MGLNHETSQDKKEIKVWVKEIEVEDEEDEEMIQIKGKPKKKTQQLKELEEN
jgi:hypothetical protein